MGTPKRYNGHHCYNCWNVSLWLSNDEGLYRMAMFHVNLMRQPGTKYTATSAAYRMIDSLPECTPDGAKYTVKAVRSALIGLME